MPWPQLIVNATAANADSVSELLMEAGAMAVTLRDRGAAPLYEPAPGATPLWPDVAVVALFSDDTALNAALPQLRAALGEGAVSGARVEALEDRDWVRAGRAGFVPTHFGARLWVCPSWSPAPDPGAVNVILDPGLAFGTGAHATTALCLDWLAGAPVDGAEAVDYGCGSGILAIAAACLGARRVWAVDNDPQALQATSENARRNGVQARIIARAPADLPPLQADLLLANILAGPLLELAPRLAALVRPGGDIVLSGILADQAPHLRSTYSQWFDMGPASEREGWVRLHGTRRTSIEC